MNDPIVEEVRHARAKIAARNGYDLDRIVEDARRRQGLDGRSVVSFEPAETGDSTGFVREDPPQP
jgi:multidrug resistance efflux pump